jgi:hypothetical protein
VCPLLSSCPGFCVLTASPGRRWPWVLICTWRPCPHTHKHAHAHQGHASCIVVIVCV